MSIGTAPFDRRHHTNGHQLTRADAAREFADAREVAVLADLIDNPQFLDDVEWLEPEHFRDDRLGLVLETLRQRRRSGEPNDLNSLGVHFAQTGVIPEKIDHQLFNELAKSRSTSDPIGLARQIRMEGERRRFISTLESIRGVADDLSVPTADLARLVSNAAEGLLREVSAPTILSVSSLVEKYPSLREPMIEGVLRQGEVFNIIAKSKVGKSWFGYAMGLCVAMGLPWLGRFPTTRGRVLLIDNELHPETLSDRIRVVLEAMGLTVKDSEGWFEVFALRGQRCDVNDLARTLRAIKPGTYTLIIVDAFYRVLPDGTSENDNAQMTAVYNAINNIGDYTRAAFSLIHHSTKGSQGDKDVTDVGSGAGAISRAADTHLILRALKDDDTVVLEARTRSWEPIKPFRLRWNFPLWLPHDEIDHAKPAEKRSPADEGKQTKDEIDCDTIISVLREGPLTARKLRTPTHCGGGTLDRLLQLLVDQKRITFTKTNERGNECKLYNIAPDVTSSASDFENDGAASDELS